MKTAIASYRNSLLMEFGSMMGYTMYVLTGGENKIHPANETHVENCFNEQKNFYEKLQGKTFELEKGLNKSVRSLSTHCIKKLDFFFCSNKVLSELPIKDQYAILMKAQTLHEFLMDSFNDPEVFKPGEYEFFKE
mmetsp:Transcript_35609/g.34640  ORF Transcript_35609/g.34640 Transcript_35609/m.34640 type:complete len:135 (+) Transcript_35609:373-777(+)